MNKINYLIKSIAVICIVAISTSATNAKLSTIYCKRNFTQGTGWCEDTPVPAQETQTGLLVYGVIKNQNTNCHHHYCNTQVRIEIEP